MPGSYADERIRVLRVVARLNVGGPALHTVLLTERLDPRRYDSRLVAGSPEPDEGDWLALQGKSVDGLIRLPSLRREVRGASDVAAWLSLVALMRRFRPHVVHTHTAKAGTLGRLAALATGVPVLVHTFHGHVFDGYFSPAKTRLFLAIERWLAQRTTRILAVSDSVRAELLDLGIGHASGVTVLPLGLDLDGLFECDRRRGELRRELGLSDDAPVVGIVARLVPIKAHEVFLAAAERVIARVPHCRFLVVGDGERRAELEALARRLGLADRVSFLGWRRDLDRVYADLDVVALSSRNEGSPVALIEAMAAARAVVATRVGGVPDLVEHDQNGLLVASGDAAGLADATCALLGDAARRARLGQAGRASVIDCFSAARLAAEMDGLYAELLAGLPGGHPRRLAAAPAPAEA